MIKFPTLLSLSITGVNIFARLFHLFVFLLIGNLYGLGDTTDLVFLVYAPLAVIMSVTAGAAEVIIMPGVHRAQAYNCVPEFLYAIFVRAMVFVALATLIALTVSILISTDVASNYVIIALLAPIPFLSCISSFASNMLNAHDKFRLAVLGPIFGTAGAVLVLFLLPQSPTALALTLFFYEAGSAVGLWFIARQFVSGGTNNNPDMVKQVTRWAMGGARMQIIGSLLAALTPMISILFAKSLDPGAVSTVEYANRLWNLVPLLFTGSLMIFYSQRSKAESRQAADLGATHAMARNLGLISLILSLVAIILAKDIVDSVYSWGKMNNNERTALAHLLTMYLLGSSAYIAGLVYVRAISAMGKVHILTLAALLGVILNIALNTIMIRYFGLSGIGIAASLTNIAVALFVYNRFVSQSAPHR